MVDHTNAMRVEDLRAVDADAIHDQGRLDVQYHFATKEKYNNSNHYNTDLDDKLFIHGAMTFVVSNALCMNLSRGFQQKKGIKPVIANVY